MPDPSFKLMSRMTQTTFSKSVWFLKACCRRKQDGFVSMQPEQPLQSLQHSGVVIDNQNNVPIFQSTISLICPSQDPLENKVDPSRWRFVMVSSARAH